MANPPSYSRLYGGDICLLWLLSYIFQIINTYTEAVETVDPKIASGKPHTLWCEFAKFYEQADQVEDVSIIREPLLSHFA